MVERAGEEVVELSTAKDAVKAVWRFGSRVKTKSDLNLWFYDDGEDEWYPRIVKRGSIIELRGHRPDVFSPFASSALNILFKAKEQQRAAMRGERYVLRDVDPSRLKAGWRSGYSGKNSWVQDSFEILDRTSGVAGYVSLLELLYAVNPGVFTFLETWTDKQVAQLVEACL